MFAMVSVVLKIIRYFSCNIARLPPFSVSEMKNNRSLKVPRGYSCLQATHDAIEKERVRLGKKSGGAVLDLKFTKVRKSAK